MDGPNIQPNPGNQAQQQLDQRNKNIGRSNSYINPPTNIYNNPPNSQIPPPDQHKTAIYSGGNHYGNNGQNIVNVHRSQSHIQNGVYGRIPAVSHQTNASAASNAFLHNTMSSSDDMLNTSTSDIPQNATLR